MYRLAGSILFLLTDERAVLFLFPNVFEPWFIFVAAIHHLPAPLRWTPTRVAAVLAVLTVLKLGQEWALHVGQVFESMTSIQFLEEVWRWLTGGS
jgi:hypothetical protein